MIKKIYNKLVLHRWSIAFAENSLDEVLNGKKIQLKFVKHDFKRRWFADPFILDYDDEKIILLVEDYSDSDKKGKISRLIVNRKTMELEDVKIILELDSHLSFPAIKRENGRIFIYPENGSGRGLVLYEYNMETDTCQEIKSISSQPFADAIMTEIDGEDYLFSINGANPHNNVLEVWNRKETEEQYRLIQEIGFKEAIARNAGDFFFYRSNLFRPAQECNYMYGHSISLQRINKKDDVFNMYETTRIQPPGWNRFGIHTFNVYKDLIVLDVKEFRHPWIAFFLFKVRNIFK